MGSEEAQRLRRHLSAGAALLVLVNPDERAEDSQPLFLRQRRAAARHVPGKQELRCHLGVQPMAQQMSRSGGDGVVSRPLGQALPQQPPPVGPGVSVGVRLAAARGQALTEQRLSPSNALQDSQATPVARSVAGARGNTLGPLSPRFGADNRYE